MIKVKRPNPPLSLEKNWRQWTQEYLMASPKDRIKLESRYRKDEIREQLAKMFNGKCAYCESIIGVVDYAHIEHFRPKKLYPKRTYLWRNMLLSCTKCNSAKYKGAKFPSDAEGGPLINPSVDEPAKHFDFVYDPKTKTARVRPTSNRGTITEITLGLNRLELLKMRSEVLRRLICIRINADADPEAKAIINDALSHNGAYMAFMKKYLAP